MYLSTTGAEIQPGLSHNRDLLLKSEAIMHHSISPGKHIMAYLASPNQTPEFLNHIFLSLYKPLMGLVVEDSKLTVGKLESKMPD